MKKILLSFLIVLSFALLGGSAFLLNGCGVEDPNQSGGGFLSPKILMREMKIQMMKK